MAILRSFCSLALTLVALSSLYPTALATPSPQGPTQCIAFDAFWNLHAFNFGGKDYNAGPLTAGTDSGSGSSTTTITPKDITSTRNRPPFDVTTSSPLCFLSQFTNSIYVLNADKSDTNSVYIYDAGRGTWSKQPTTGAPASYDPKEFGVILDRDTNVFYSYYQGTMYSLDMALKANGSSEAVPWNLVQKPDLTATDEGVQGAPLDGYQPTMALAQNHVHFMGVPGFKAGDVKVFVIHYSYMQPLPQSYGSFATTHGKTASFFKDIGVQTRFAYIPDDGKNTYVVDVISNSTATFPAPPSLDPYAEYAASPSALVRLSSDSGKLSWMNYDNSSSAASRATWRSITLTGVEVASPASAAAGPKNNNGTSKSGAKGATETDHDSGAVGLQVWNALLMGLVGVVGAVGLAL